MRKITYLFLLIFIILYATSCGIKYPELEDNAIGFKVSEFIDINDDNASYSTIEYNGRTYMPYGVLKGILKKEDIDRCIGYIIQDENISSIIDENNKDTRIYTLTSDKDNNFLMEYYIGTNLMNPPSFYRAIDTLGEDLVIPKYIQDLDYNYWK